MISTVPTAAEKSGAFGTTPIFDPGSTVQLNPTTFTRNPFPGNQIPLTSISQQGQALAALYPDPNLPGTVNNYRFTPALIDKSASNSTLAPIKSFSSRSRLMARTSSYESQNGLSPDALPGSFASSDSVQNADGANTDLTAWTGALAHTFVLRPSMVNEFRADVMRFGLGAQALDNGLECLCLL